MLTKLPKAGPLEEPMDEAWRAGISAPDAPADERGEPYEPVPYHPPEPLWDMPFDSTFLAGMRRDLAKKGVKVKVGSFALPFCPFTGCNTKGHYHP